MAFGETETPNYRSREIFRSVYDGLSLVKQSTDIKKREKEWIKEEIKSVHTGYAD